MDDPGTVVVGRHWHDDRSELTFAARSLAGAASRWGPVSILVPGPAGDRATDGAFDLTALGPPDAPAWPEGLSPDWSIVVDELTPDIADLLSRVGARTVRYLVRSVETTPEPGWSRLRLADLPGPVPTPLVPLYVPVNPMAQRQRHHGFGFVGYLLVLPGPADRGGRPPDEAAWLTAALPGADVVVVERAMASVWRGRALRGRVTVDTRMDLWRLLAHAAACVDLAPGDVVARECVEALRFGTPIVVPARSGAAAVHAGRGGGATFGDQGELVAAADALRVTGAREAASVAARTYADAAHGDSGAFVDAVGTLLGAR